MNARPQMKRSMHYYLPVALCVFLLCIPLVPFVSAEPVSATPSATVPPVLLACSHARYPEAQFTCGFLNNQSAVIPDGPPYPVDCVDLSSTESDQPIVSWKWEFGDGGTSLDQNPRHSYSDARLYDIRLTVTTWCGSKYSNTTVNSTYTYCSVPEPVFTTNVTEGFAPLAIGVTDASKNAPENITRWTYWFDNTHLSHERNPVFIYTQPGTYTINQTVWKDCVQLGSNLPSPSKRQIIVNSPPSLVSGVNGTNTTPTIPLALSPAIPVTGALPDATAPAATLKTTDSVAATDSSQTGAGMPGSGTLFVITNPSGVQIFVDNVLRGTSPVTVPDLSEGSHTLRLEREGYQNQTFAVLINDGTMTSFSTTLAPVSGGIAILPVIALMLIILGIVAGGIYLYRTQKVQNPE